MTAPGRRALSPDADEGATPAACGPVATGGRPEALRGDAAPLTPRRLLKPLWFVLALVFLAEAWLWDHLRPAVAWIVARVPLRALKAWLRARIADLSPAAALAVFLVPVAGLFPLKLAALWLLAHERWLAAALLLVAAKLAGVGITAFIFDATRPKLLQMRWFRRLYDAVLRMRAWAHRFIAPALAAIRAALARGRAGALRRFARLVRRFRRAVQRARAG